MGPITQYNNTKSLGGLIMFNSTKKFLIFVCLGTLISLTVLQPISAAYNESNGVGSTTNTTIESFTIETFSENPNTEGFYVNTGYKVVSSSTIIVSENGYPVSAEINSLEDNYDISGNYIDTVIKHEEMYNDYDSGKAKVKIENDISTNPVNGKATINPMIENKNNYQKITLDDSEKKLLADKIKLHVEKLPETNFNEIKGITSKEFNAIKEKAIEYQKSKASINTTEFSVTSTSCPTVSNGVEMCGAFDNYYRHNVSNGDFTVQALGFAGEDSMYTRQHGNVAGNASKASILSSFKSYINAYEGYVVQDMEASSWPEVVGWGSAIASFALLVAGWATGPTGWTAIVLNYSNALLVFVGLTSSAYSTYSRMQLSRNATTQQQNAINAAYNMFYYQDFNYGFSYESGF